MCGADRSKVRFKTWETYMWITPLLHLANPKRDVSFETLVASSSTQFNTASVLLPCPLCAQSLLHEYSHAHNRNETLSCASIAVLGASPINFLDQVVATSFTVAASGGPVRGKIDGS